MDMHDEFFKAREFRSILLDEFNQRKKRRTAYSIRAFARDLNVKAATFNGVLRGRYGISESTARQIAERLKFNEDQTEFFVALVNSRHARTKNERHHAKFLLKKFQFAVEYEQLAADQAEVFASWYNLAILELITIHAGNMTSAHMAKELGISVSEVEGSLNLLVRAKLITPSNKKFVRNKDYISLESEIPSRILRSYHKQLMDRAKAAIEEQPIPKRKFLSSVMSFDPARVNEARQWLEKNYQDFIDEFCSETKVGPDHAVYTYAIQLFELTGGNKQ